MWEKELEIAKGLAIEAGKAIMEIYNGEKNYEIEYKENNSPLTVADKKANDIIVKVLKEKFPEYAVLSEEEKDNKERLHNDYCFIVDPLDGTKEFIKRNGQFTVNIALAYKHHVVMGVIYVPASEELYYATKGKGGFKKESAGEIRRLLVSQYKGEISSLRVVASSSHGCNKLDKLIEKYHFNNIVNVGSSLKGCMIAEGKADIYYRFNPTMEWDTAAMQCIVEEAGAIFKQMDGSDMIYNREDNLNKKGFYIVNHTMIEEKIDINM